MNTIAIIASDSTRTDAGHRHVRRRLSVVLLAAALLGATSCGSESTTEVTSSTTTIAVAASTSTSSVVPPSTATAVAASTVTSVVLPTTTATIVPRPTATIDQLTGDEGRRVHVRCVGRGDETVLLIAGFGTGADGWAQVEPAIAASARVCSYDRPGTGTSDPTTSIATFTTRATELHALMTRIGEPGPYVVVGHSFGGAEAITFASLYADEVTGLVLVDASPTAWTAALCAVPDDGTDGAAMLRGNCTGAFLPTGNSERLDVSTAFAEVSTIVSLGSLPMAVITATARSLPADLVESEVARLTEIWNQGQQDWMALSTDAHLVSVDDTSHHIEIDQPGVVIDEITRLLP